MSDTTLIAFHPEGFECRFTFDIAKLEPVVTWLLEHDFRPQLGFQYTPEGLPVCPRHGIPMVKREKQGDVWYSHNIGTEENPLWCRGYRHNSSPGWNVAPKLKPLEQVDLAASTRRYDDSHARELEAEAVKAHVARHLEVPDAKPDPDGRPRDVHDIADDIFS